MSWLHQHFKVRATGETAGRVLTLIWIREYPACVMTFGERAIGDRLIERGQILPGGDFTNNPEANSLLNDLNKHPHAFVLGCLMDRQVDSERCWLVPYKLSQKLGGFAMNDLRKLSQVDVEKLMSEPEPLHRYSKKMSEVFYSAVQRIAEDYEGNAALIWDGRPSSAEAVYRFLEFKGAGPKIATMAVNILARDFKVEFTDLTSIDISADVQVIRVLARLGLCPPEPTIEQVMYKARALNPSFPGILDQPCWEIGKRWCRPNPRDLKCTECYMQDLCLTANPGRLGMPGRND